MIGQVGTNDRVLSTAPRIRARCGNIVNRESHYAMASSRQGDLFASDPQAELFDEDRPTPVYRADPDKVRNELLQILAEARAASTLPWEPRKLSYYRTVFPQMANWLPDDEADQLRFEFAAELARLQAA
ncbi:hypothetical protein BJ123_102126 [Rhodopseudomonas thermotolerans]|uniref:Uncharacterized protein n=2 Tax=Rhodopseudomonas TaxID=1073 RepID=A0A336JHR0_9BRAD|nr:MULTISPECIES: hypothetical protein [Rhodopseudomonas]RED41955.1 hypothetical protein BJ125_102124 [Rhodopseudomonas pentothenatexigens]REG07416.1 hypothetical protein BJ123_102126 [Rhodopseudomonas thermotolerans]SSW89315.1 hypothetical protein SAMN05892882_102124 [Rhodopseudomonas pentothenatexigens]